MQGLHDLQDGMRQVDLPESGSDAMSEALHHDCIHCQHGAEHEDTAKQALSLSSRL